MSSKKDLTRERILKSTWALLEAGGGSAVRMSDIAKAAKVSRQTLYLHFPNRADLLVATTRYLDDVHDIEERLHASRTAKSGTDRLGEWIEAWGNYIPTVYGVAKALMAMKETDKEAAIAWDDRMQAVREGCAAAVAALKRDGELTASLGEDEAVDVLWTLLSIRSWEMLRLQCGWSQRQYIDHLKAIAARVLTSDSAVPAPLRSSHTVM